MSWLQTRLCRLPTCGTTAARISIRQRKSKDRHTLMCCIVVAACFIAAALPEAVLAQSPEESPAATSSPDEKNPNDEADSVGSPESASKRLAIPKDPLDIVSTMSPVFVVPFVIASFMALWFSVERLVILRRGRVIPRPFVERFLQHLQQGQLNPAQALKLCAENGSPVAAIFAHGIRKWGKPSVEVEQAIIDGGERQVSLLRKHLRVINGVATVAPLLGLLGTVIGMILAFNDVASSDAMGKPEELASGIALALLTTAAGLTIAIPSLILYMYLAGRVDALVMEMDELGQSVVHLISAEALSERPATATRSRTRRAQASETSGKKAV